MFNAPTFPGICKSKTLNCQTKTWDIDFYAVKVQTVGLDTWASIERIPTTAINAATVSDEKRITWEGRAGWDIAGQAVRKQHVSTQSLQNSTVNKQKQVVKKNTDVNSLHKRFSSLSDNSLCTCLITCSVSIKSVHKAIWEWGQLCIHLFCLNTYIVYLFSNNIRLNCSCMNYRSVWGVRLKPNLEACVSFFKVCLTETCQTGLTASSPLFAQHYHLSVVKSLLNFTLTWNWKLSLQHWTIPTHLLTSTYWCLITRSGFFWYLREKGYRNLLIPSTKCRSNCVLLLASSF